MNVLIDRAINLAKESNCHFHCHFKNISGFLLCFCILDTDKKENKEKNRRNIIVLSARKKKKNTLTFSTFAS